MKIRVHNAADRETVRFPLPLLIGDVEGLSQDGRLLVSSSGDPDGVIDWPIVGGRFKVLVRLQPGENVINLRWEQESLTLRLTYDLPGFTNVVRPVYIICADDDGFFQGPDGTDCSPESAVKRISLGSQLIQTLTAEKMREQGFGRVTFQLDMGDDHRPLCHIFRSRLRLEEAYAMNGYELWNYFGKELMTSPQFSNKSGTKFYCFMSFTRYHLPEDAPLPKTHSEILKYTQGHTALGGGALALFGTGNLHTWADSLSTFNHCLTNRSRMDRRKLMDDSAYREYYWANYATGLGASLHELGHTFDLAHTPTGIMARGFDDLHKVFTVQRRRKSRHNHRHHHHKRQQQHQQQQQQPRQRYSSTGSSVSSDRSRSTSSSDSIDDVTPSSSSLGSSTNSSDSYHSASNQFSTTKKGSTNNSKMTHGADGRKPGSGSGGFSSMTLKRKTDVCYGSPYKQNPLASGKVPDLKPHPGSSSSHKAQSSTPSQSPGRSHSHSHTQKPTASPGHTPSHIPSHISRQSHAQKSNATSSSGPGYTYTQKMSATSGHTPSLPSGHTPNHPSSHNQAQNPKSHSQRSSSAPAPSHTPGHTSSHTASHTSRHTASHTSSHTASHTSCHTASHTSSHTASHTSSHTASHMPSHSSNQSAPPPVVSVEAGFKANTSGSKALTFSVKNYDGSETRQTILEGQTVSELTFNPDGRVVNKNNKATERRPSAISISSIASSSSFSSTSTPSTLPNSPDEPPPNLTPQMINQMPEVRYSDSAHWFRSSAVVLRYHKWFNKMDGRENGKNPSLQGPSIRSQTGLRLVELRTDPEGTVFHHREFLGPTPPNEFTLWRSEVSSMPPEDSVITIMAEDNHGYIMKKKFKVENFI